MILQKHSARGFLSLVFVGLALQSSAAFAFGPKKPEAPIAYPGDEDQRRSDAANSGIRAALQIPEITIPTALFTSCPRWMIRVIGRWIL
jgi:hypothetical protein